MTVFSLLLQLVVFGVGTTAGLKSQSIEEHVIVGEVKFLSVTKLNVLIIFYDFYEFDRDLKFLRISLFFFQHILVLCNLKKKPLTSHIYFIWMSNEMHF